MNNNDKVDKSLQNKKIYSKPYSVNSNYFYGKIHIKENQTNTRHIKSLLHNPHNIGKVSHPLCQNDRIFSKKLSETFPTYCLN